jgi:hypothetical protein
MSKRQDGSANVVDAAEFFGISNECHNQTHPLGIHRHGTVRFVRRERPAGSEPRRPAA